MKKILIILLLTCNICLSQVAVIKKEKQVTIKSITQTSWYDSTQVAYTTKDSKVGTAVGGAILGKLLFGGAGLIGGAIIGSSTPDTYTTHYRWERHLVNGYRVTMSDGYILRTRDNIYRVGQVVKYQ